MTKVWGPGNSNMGEIMNNNFENEKAQNSFTAKKNDETF